MMPSVASSFFNWYLFSLVAILSASDGTSTPNIVFIIADDLGWADVGFHGSEIKTPNIDRLARDGVILNNYYVQPMCTPTRSAILTGKYPIHTGLQHHVIIGSEPYGLPLTETTLAEELRTLGYQTHIVGKWHLGFFKEDYLPTRRGFDSHLGYYLGKEDYFSHDSHDGNYYGYDFHRNGKTEWNETGVYSTELYTSQAESIIRNHSQSKPLFLYLAHQAVHAGNKNDPIQAPQKYIDRFPYIKNPARRKFAGVVSALDDSVGKVYNALKETGKLKNTVIVFSTDNGGPANGMEGNAACNWPLRGSKKTLWQGGVRGVGFVHSPLLRQSGYVNQKMMHVSDWFPTLLSLASTKTSTGKEAKKPSNDLLREVKAAGIDGVDQWDVISDNTDTERKEVLLNIDPIQRDEGIIIGDFKLIKGRALHGKYDGWYPPPKDFIDNRDIYSDFFSNHNAFNDARIRMRAEPGSPIDKISKHSFSSDLISLIESNNKDYQHFLQRNNLIASLDRLYKTSWKPSKWKASYGSNGISRSQNRESIVVNCGPKPRNASTNCRPKNAACLYHILDDPCEYNNLADSLPGVVEKLQKRLAYYKSSMLPPANKPSDPRGNPQLHGGVWKPWL